MHIVSTSLQIQMDIFAVNVAIEAQFHLSAFVQAEIQSHQFQSRKLKCLPASFCCEMSNGWHHVCSFSSLKTWCSVFSALSIVLRVHLTHKHCPVCSLCLSVFVCFVAPSQKEDLIATVMAGKAVPTHLLWCKNEFVHFCVTSLHRIILISSQCAYLCYTLNSFYCSTHDSVSVSSDIQVQSVEELKQQKGCLKLLKKQSKELKELRKKHLKKVKTLPEKMESFSSMNGHLKRESEKWCHVVDAMQHLRVQQPCSPPLTGRCGIWVRSRRVGVPRFSLIRRGGAVGWRRASNSASRKSKCGRIEHLLTEDRMCTKCYDDGESWGKAP